MRLTPPPQFSRLALPPSPAFLAAIALACACWALDNNLAARLALKDPVQVLRIKTLCAGASNLALAFALGQPLPPLAACAGALTWTAIEWATRRKPSVLGMISGAVAGLGTITPASGSSTSPVPVRMSETC